MAPPPTLTQQVEMSVHWSTLLERLRIQPRMLEIAAGRTVLSQGRTSQFIYRIESGLMKVLHRGLDGQEIVVGLLHDGDTFGIVGAALDLPDPITAVAMTDVTLAAIPAIVIQRAIPLDPLVPDALLRINGLRAPAALEYLALLAMQPARRRVEHLLRQLAARAHREAKAEGLRLDLPFSQCELASIAHLTPETLSRAMADLEREGILRRKNGRTFYLMTKPVGA